MFCGFLLFTDTHSRRYRLTAGPIHGLVHVAATFFLGWGASYLAVTVLGLPFRSIPQLLLAGTVLLVGGARGRRSWESISSSQPLRTTRQQGLLVRIPTGRASSGSDRSRRHHDFPIGRGACHQMEPLAAPERPRFVPADPRATRPELIEPPIRGRPPRDLGSWRRATLTPGARRVAPGPMASAGPSARFLRIRPSAADVDDPGPRRAVPTPTIRGASQSRTDRVFRRAAIIA